MGLVRGRPAFDSPPPEPRIAWGFPLITREAVEEGGLDLLVAGGGHCYREAVWGRTAVVVPGAPVGLRPGDWGDRYFVTADLGADGAQLVQDVRDVSPVVEVVLDVGASGTADESALIRELQERLAGAAMARVRLTGAVQQPLDEGRLLAALDRVPAVTEFHNETVLDADGEFLKRLRNEGTIRGLFARRLEALRSEARSDAECRALDRALVLGLAEFRRLETTHAG